MNIANYSKDNKNDDEYFVSDIKKSDISQTTNHNRFLNNY